MVASRTSGNSLAHTENKKYSGMITTFGKNEQYTGLLQWCISLQKGFAGATQNTSQMWLRREAGGGAWGLHQNVDDLPSHWDGCTNLTILFWGERGGGTRCCTMSTTTHLLLDDCWSITTGAGAKWWLTTTLAMNQQKGCHTGRQCDKFVGWDTISMPMSMSMSMPMPMPMSMPMSMPPLPHRLIVVFIFFSWCKVYFGGHHWWWEGISWHLCLKIRLLAFQKLFDILKF